MRLIKLTANKPSFKTIRFKKGLNLIVGKREDPSNKDLHKTYNGVGKSLIAELIHFCLASDPISEFEKKLNGWEFMLEFEIDGKKHISTRNTKDRNKITLNRKPLSLKKFRAYFGKTLFYIEEHVPYLSFRSLVSRFIRRRKESYLSYNTYIKEEKDYAKLLNNTYLLGLDIKRAMKKYKLKKDYDKIIESKRNIERDETLQQYFGESIDVKIEIVDLEDKIREVEDHLKRFVIADDYHAMRKEADDISYKIKALENRAVVFKNAIKHIKNSLHIRPDLSKDYVAKLFHEAEVKFPESVVRRLEEVEDFHNTLLSNRVQRLQREKLKLQEKFFEIKEMREKLARKLDQLLKYLDTHGALDEFVSLTRRFSDYKAALTKLKSYRDIIESYKTKLAKIKIALQEENIATNKYLEESKSLINDNINLFRSFSREFYEDKPGGIEIINNEGENQIRFDLKVKIQDDASDGINEVKIFCFDFTLLNARHNHKMNFVFHDSRLYSNVDPRQKAVLFRIAYRNTLETGLQYIATVNEDMLMPLKELYTPKEYKDVIEKNIRLELTDKSEKTKLLGIQVDMDYEK